MGGVVHLHRGHEFFDMLVVQLQDAVQDADLVVAQGLLAVPMERQERPGTQEVLSIAALRVEKRDVLKLGLLVRVGVVRAEDPVEQLGDRVGDGRCARAALEARARACAEGCEWERLTEEVHHAEDDGGAGRADGETIADASGLGDDSGG